IGCAVHLAMIGLMLAPAERRATEFDAARIATWTADRARDVVLYSAHGHAVAAVITKDGTRASCIAFAEALLVLGLALAQRNRHRLLPLSVVAGLCMIWMAAYAVVGTSRDPLPSRHFFAEVPLATRYTFMPYCAVAFAVANAWEAALGSRVRALRRLGWAVA